MTKLMLQTLRAILLIAWQNLFKHELFQAAAALSFYAVFSLAPLVLIVIAIAGLFFSDAEVQATLILRIRELISDDAGQLVETIIDNTTNEERNVFSLIVGGIVMLIGSTTAFAHLHGVLNKIWDVRPSGRLAVWQVVQGRLWSFAFLITIGLLLVASLLLSTLLDTFNEFLSTRIVIDPSFWTRLDLLISYGVTTLLIATIYKFLPDTRVRWRDTFIGAVIAALLFELSKRLIEYYIGQIDPESSFGAAGSVVVFLLWVYCASLIILVGAECSRIAALHAGQR